MKHLLAIDTATPACSIALTTKDGVLLREASGQGIHSEAVFTFTKEVLDEAEISISEISAVLLPEGPGSYTGLRIASSAVKGMLFGLDIPVVAINTLACMAWPYRNHQGAIHAVLDARRSHLYHQEFSGFEKVLAPKNAVTIRDLGGFEQLVSENDIITGTGLERLPDSLGFAIRPNAMNAEVMITFFKASEMNASSLCKQVTAASYTPEYYANAQVLG